MDSKEYEIWSEGFASSDGFGKADFHGKYSGNTFQEACIAMMKDQKFEMEKYYNADRNSYWLCRFFDNEIDARKSFG